jgi:hypothetical protein
MILNLRCICGPIGSSLLSVLAHNPRNEPQFPIIKMTFFHLHEQSLDVNDMCYFQEISLQGKKHLPSHASEVPKAGRTRKKEPVSLMSLGTIPALY